MNAILQDNNTAVGSVLYMAMELSHQKWKLGFSNSEKIRVRTIDARDWVALKAEIQLAKTKLHCSAEGRVMSCYEAGRDGFWIHRALVAESIENHVLDSASIEVSRRKRKVKTDKVDAVALLKLLIRFANGEKTALHCIRIPTVEDEDQRRLTRERDRLIKERGAHSARIKSLLIAHGISLDNISDLPKLLLKMTAPIIGYDIPMDLKAELKREYQRYVLVDNQTKELERLQIDRAKAQGIPAMQNIQHLRSLKGVGWQSSWILTMEFFNWRKFRNAKQLASCAGLTPTPYDSGSSIREQGISKAGNKRIRKLMVELSWLWLRYQPNSQLSKWFEKRFGSGGSRMRRIGIVAVARKLLISLWRYLETGAIPEGAVLKVI